MVRVIETNLSVNDDDKIIDHQSRVIEVETWESYIDEILEAKTVIRQSLYGNLHGNTIPRGAKIRNMVYDDFHLRCDIYSATGMKTKKLAYLVDKN